MANFFFILVIIFSHIDLERGFPVRGAPKYFEGKKMSLNSRIFAICNWIGKEVFMKKSLDFATLMEMCEASVKLVRMDLKARASLTKGVPIRKVSSTNL